MALDVLGNNIMCWGLLSPVPNGDSGAPHDLPRIALRIKLAKTGPFTKFVIVVHLDERDAMLLTESLDEFLVCGLVAVFC